MKPLNDYVWERLPLSKFTVGRRKVNSLAWMAGDLHARGQSSEDIATQMCNDEKKYGMGILTAIFLSAIVNQIVRLVVEWYKKRRHG